MDPNYKYWRYICGEIIVLKSFGVILLLVSFFAQTFQQAVTVLGFYSNQSYIASKLCENRYKPMLHCNGKCVLAKKLRQEERKDQQNPGRKLENRVEVFCCSRMTIDIPAFSISGSYDSTYPEIGLIDLSFPVFHPPSV
jgi:hypothetical protein